MIVRDKNFYRLIFAIAAPIGVQSFISFMVNLLDTLMVGQLGENALSGANLAGQMFFITVLATAGVSEGSNVLISQYYGKNDIKSIHKIYAIAYRGTTIISIIAFCIAFFFPEQFMKIYTTEPEVIEQGVMYLKIMAIGYIPFTFASCTVTTLRAVRSTKIAMCVYGTSFLVNAFLNYSLIFGNFGMPRLEIRGAAIATVVARFVEFFIIMFYMAKIDKKIQLKLQYLKSVDIEFLKNFMKNSAPILLNEILWGLGSTSLSIIFGRMGKSMVSANAISSVMFQLVSIFLFGVASSALVIIGNTIGEGKVAKAYEYSKTFIILEIILGIFASSTIFLTKDIVIGFYNITPETAEIAQIFLTANSIIVFFQAIAIINGMGILRGGGDSKFVLGAEIICLWLIAIPFGFLSAFYFNFPVFLVFCCTKIDEILKAFVFIGRTLFSKWAKDLTVDAD
ncbi:MAG: MATE family efflux transporter [Clostridia bacterium]